MNTWRRKERQCAFAIALEAKVAFRLPHSFIIGNEQRPPALSAMPSPSVEHSLEGRRTNARVPALRAFPPRARSTGEHDAYTCSQSSLIVHVEPLLGSNESLLGRNVRKRVALDRPRAIFVVPISDCHWSHRRCPSRIPAKKLKEVATAAICGSLSNGPPAGL